MKLVALGRTLNLEAPNVMGILNVTPDSFSDGGKYQTLTSAIDHTAEMLANGATIIDIGGESTRPGAQTISDEEETERVVPIIMALSKRFDVFISVDTSKSLVIKESAKAGAHLINDIRALREPNALKAALNSQLLICLGHMQGEPRTMQANPRYKNVFEEIKKFFAQKISHCEATGIKKNRLLIDPGFGFGKNLEHNYQILAQLGQLHCFNLPLVVGMSRKSMIGNIINAPVEKRIFGSISCAVIAALQGAQIIRAHDVKETVEAMKIVKAIFKAKEFIQKSKNT
ncbi:dihydropteroate synthase [Sodalis sp. CWE]|uniref:dihydropteroate synthase n=1 Tax=Sodalis sp. CWE TaxID=2803816 RepID=UPI001C7D58A8|nr:dihydropteroate synthase [Sodalis sp. CWE]